MSGQIKDDSDILRLKDQYLVLLHNDMRGRGYVPLLDLDPAWSTSLIDGRYHFLMTVHGVYYGKKKARKYVGLAGSKLIMG